MGAATPVKSSHGGMRRLCQTSTKLGLKGIIVDTTVGKSDLTITGIHRVVTSVLS